MTQFLVGRLLGMNISASFALLISLSLMPLAQADELGRLFFTPSERNQLEHRQAQQALKARITDSGDGNKEQSVITVNSLIKRSDGSRIVWIDGKVHRLGFGSNPSKVPVTVPGQQISGDQGRQRLIPDNPAPMKPAAPSAFKDDD